MLNNEELERLHEMLAAGRDRSDPLTLSATDQIMDAMMRQQEAVVAVHEAADRQRALEEGMQRAQQDVDRAAQRQAAAADRAAAREGREVGREAAAERAQREHFERNIAAADRIHEARAMRGGVDFVETRKSFLEGGDLATMTFSELLQARADALGLSV